MSRLRSFCTRDADDGTSLLPIFWTFARTSVSFTMSRYIDRHQVKLVCYGLFRANYSPIKALINLQDLQNGFIPKRRTVFYWYKEFRSGEIRFEDKPKPGKKPFKVTKKKYSKG